MTRTVTTTMRRSTQEKPKSAMTWTMTVMAKSMAKTQSAPPLGTQTRMGTGSETKTVPSACTAPSGYVSDNTDCDDSTDDANPDEFELCDGIDNDCDGGTDEPDAIDAPTWYDDDDEDGYGR